MFEFNGVSYKSKSEVALNLLKEGKSRAEISKTLGITYQTVHAIMKKAGLKPLSQKKKDKKSKKSKSVVSNVSNVSNVASTNVTV